MNRRRNEDEKPSEGAPSGHIVEDVGSAGVVDERGRHRIVPTNPDGTVAEGYNPVDPRQGHKRPGRSSEESVNG